MGVLAAAIPRDAVNDAITVSRRGAKRSGGKLPPHVMVYYALALALFPDEDYEEVFTRLSATLTSWGCWDPAWEIPTSGGITQARTRLGVEPLAELFDTVATPIADELTPGAFLGSWRLISIDGLEFDAPDTPANITAFGRAGGSGQKASAFAKPRLLTLVECASHAPVAAVIGGQHQGEQTLARDLWPLLEPDWLVIADANFYSYRDYSAAAESGAALVWRLSASVRTPVLTEWGMGPTGRWCSRPGCAPAPGRRSCGRSPRGTSRIRTRRWWCGWWSTPCPTGGRIPQRWFGWSPR